MIKKLLVFLLITITFLFGMNYIYAEENETESEDKPVVVVEPTQEVVASEPTIINNDEVEQVTTGSSEESAEIVNSEPASNETNTTETVVPEGEEVNTNSQGGNETVIPQEENVTTVGSSNEGELASVEEPTQANDEVVDEPTQLRGEPEATPPTYNYDYTIVTGEGTSNSLAAIFSSLGVEVNLIDIDSVTQFPDGILTIVKSGDDYTISSSTKVTTQVVLTVTLTDGTKYVIRLTDASVPSHSKDLIDNGDGTYTLELSVTGDADDETQEAGGVNIVVVYDVSQSMTNDAGSSRNSRADQAEDVVHDFLTNLATYQNQSGDNINVSLVTFAVTASQEQGWTTNVTGLANRFEDGGTDGRISFNYNGFGTNWEAALQRAQTLVNNADSTKPTFVIMITDGAPTASGNGSNAVAPTGASIDTLRDRYNAATNEAYAIANSVGPDGTFYGIYAYGTEADLLDDLMYYSKNNQHRGNNIRNVVAATEDAPNYYNAGETSQLQAAIDEIFDKVVQAMGISSAAISDGTTNQVTTSTGGIAELLEIDEDSYEYWISIPVVNNKFTRTNRDGDSVEYTVTQNGDECTVTWESQSVTVPGTISNGHFKYKWTTANALYNYDAPEAELTDSGAVDWNLSSVGTLLDGVKYSVTFIVYPSQTTLDYVADIKNDPGEDGAWGDLDPAIQQYISPDGTLRTNTVATLSYVDTRTGEQGTVSFSNPDPVAAEAVEQIAVTKEWENRIDGQEQPPVTLTVTRDGKNTYTVTLSDDNDWSDRVFVSIGIIDKNGRVLEGSEGHDFTFVEPQNLSYHWELDVPVVHPMLINGVLTMLIKVDEKHPVPDGVTTYTIKGDTYYVDNASVALTAINERRSRLDFTKIVEGVDVPEDAEFPFTFTIVNSLAPETEPTDDPEHNSDYWVWISVRDANGTRVTSGVTGATHKDSDPGYWYAPSGTTITVIVKSGYSIRVLNLPTGTTYTIVEGTLPTRFVFDDANLTIEGEGTDSTFNGGRTTTGTIESTNTIYKVAYTNVYELIDINVDKVWDDGSDRDGVRPETLTLTLNGAPTGTTIPTPTITVSEDGNTWTYVWKALPRYNGNTEIEYTVTEGTVPEGYTCETTTVSDGGTITNVHETTKVSVHGTKTWYDGDSSNRPSVTIVLLKKVTNAETGEVSYDIVERKALASDNTYSFDNLPKFENGGNLIEYSVQELTLGGDYISEMTKVSNYEYNFTNTLLRDITVNKIWHDENANTRPNSITVVLLVGEETVASHEITGPNWSYTFEDLPAYDANGEITYKIQEVSVNGYEVSYSDYNIINTLLIDVTVNKYWDDDSNRDGVRPETLTLTLNGVPEGVEVPTPTITVSEDGNTWIYTWSNLPGYNSDGSKITYTITENTIPEGYTCEKTTVNAGETITNTHETEKSDVTVTKVWEDNNDQDGIRPEEIEVTLYADGKEVETVKLNESNKWSYTWKQLDVKANGKDIEYTVSEVEVDGYTTKINGLTITNTHETEKSDVTVTKVWEDNNDQDGIRPEEIEVTLYADGKEVETVKLNESNKWSYTWKQLDVKANGKDIEYTVSEVEVEGYTTKIDGLTITNTHETETTEVTVSKVWDDKDNYDGIRPNSVTIILYANGDKVTSVELSESNGWTYTWTKLDKKENGVDIEYSVEEEDIEGYEAEITGNMKDGFVVTNTHYGEGGDVPPTPPVNPKTGDNVYTYLFMLLISLFGLVKFTYSYVKNN